MKNKIKWLVVLCTFVCSMFLFAGCFWSSSPNYLDKLNTATNNSLKNPTVISNALTIEITGDMDAEYKIEMAKMDDVILTRIESLPSLSSRAWLYVYNLRDKVANRLTRYEFTRSGLDYRTIAVSRKQSLENNTDYIYLEVMNGFADFPGFKIADIESLNNATEISENKIKCTYTNEWYGSGMANSFEYISIVNTETENPYLEQINLNWTYSEGSHKENGENVIKFNYSVFDTAGILELYEASNLYDASL